MRVSNKCCMQLARFKSVPVPPLLQCLCCEKQNRIAFPDVCSVQLTEEETSSPQWHCTVFHHMNYCSILWISQKEVIVIHSRRNNPTSPKRKQLTNATPMVCTRWWSRPGPDRPM